MPNGLPALTDVPLNALPKRSVFPSTPARDCQAAQDDVRLEAGPEADVAVEQRDQGPAERFDRHRQADDQVREAPDGRRQRLDVQRQERGGQEHAGDGDHHDDHRGNREHGKERQRRGVSIPATGHVDRIH